MALKVPLIVVGTVIVATVCALGWYQSVDDTKNNNKDLVIETVGLDELGVRLESAYRLKSPQHVLLINKSSHHLLACEIVYEFILSTGEIRASRKIVAYTRLLKEKDSIARKALLASEPSIKPNTTTLIGMGSDIDVIPITGALPSLPPSSTVEETFRNPEHYERLVIRLNAIVVEDGRAFGPGAEQFLINLYHEVLQKEQP